MLPGLRGALPDNRVDTTWADCSGLPQDGYSQGASQIYFGSAFPGLSSGIGFGLGRDKFASQRVKFCPFDMDEAAMEKEAEGSGLAEDLRGRDLRIKRLKETSEPFSYSLRLIFVRRQVGGGEVTEVVSGNVE